MHLLLHGYTMSIFHFIIYNFLTEAFQNFQSEKKEKEKKVNFKMQRIAIGINPGGKDCFCALTDSLKWVGGFSHLLTLPR